MYVCVCGCLLCGVGVDVVVVVVVDVCVGSVVVDAAAGVVVAVVGVVVEDAVAVGGGVDGVVVVSIATVVVVAAVGVVDVVGDVVDVVVQTRQTPFGAFAPASLEPNGSRKMPSDSEQTQTKTLRRQRMRPRFTSRPPRGSQFGPPLGFGAPSAQASDQAPMPTRFGMFAPSSWKPSAATCQGVDMFSLCCRSRTPASHH